MRLYHGSHIAIPSPDVLHSRARVDFGVGFYTTPILQQAQKWAKRFVTRFGHGVVSAYDCDAGALSDLKVLDFPSYSDEWLDFVTECRRLPKTAVDGHYDVIRGGVANDKVFNTCGLYFKGLISKDVALNRLRIEEPNLQLCFKNQVAIANCLKFVGSDVVGGFAE